MLNKEQLKQTWLYRHWGRVLTWPKYFIIHMKLKRKYFWMTYQKNWMIDPCTDIRISLHWWIFVLAGMVVALIAVISVLYQSIRTARTNPAVALKKE